MGKLMEILAAPFALKRLKQARALFDELTPLKSDCGRQCDHACCKADEDDENGMLLYPFEDRLYRKPIEGFDFRLENDDTLFKGGKRLICNGRCPRDARPLACRIFPLRMKLVCDADGAHTHAVAEVDPRAWAVCPLPDDGTSDGRVFPPRKVDPTNRMSSAFKDAVAQAGSLLCQNVYMLEALENEQRTLDSTRGL